MLQVNDLHIRFGQESVIERFSCHISPSDFVCLTGKSGCGKSSLLKAFIGLVPFEGTIRVCGEPLNEKTCDAIRRTVAYLPQDLSFPGEFVQDVVSQTLRLGKLQPGSTPDEALRHNLSLLGLEEDILRKRMSEISGGQRPRLILATIALLHKTLWLLDEPTSALDNITQKQVSDALDRMRCTRIVIAHRLSTIRHCDRILVMDGGKIVEDGKYEQLIEKGGVFAELVERQRLDK